MLNTKSSIPGCKFVWHSQSLHEGGNIQVTFNYSFKISSTQFRTGLAETKNGQDLRRGAMVPAYVRLRRYSRLEHASLPRLG